MKRTFEPCTTTRERVWLGVMSPNPTLVKLEMRKYHTVRRSQPSRSHSVVAHAVQTHQPPIKTESSEWRDDGITRGYPPRDGTGSENDEEEEDEDGDDEEGEKEGGRRTERPSLTDTSGWNGLRESVPRFRSAMGGKGKEDGVKE